MGDKLNTFKKQITDCEDDDNECRTEIKTELQARYNNNTSELHDNFKLNNEVETLKNEITNKTRMLTEAKTEHGVAQTKMKAVIYDTKGNEDKLKFFYLISVLHIIILIMILLGYINSQVPRYKVFNNSNNSNRSKFNYDEHGIPFESSGSCSVKPTTPPPEEVGNDEAVEAIVAAGTGGN